jgi:hypothetical protein
MDIPLPSITVISLINLGSASIPASTLITHRKPKEIIYNEQTRQIFSISKKKRHRFDQKESTAMTASAPLENRTLASDARYQTSNLGKFITEFLAHASKSSGKVSIR